MVRTLSPRVSLQSTGCGKLRGRTCCVKVNDCRPVAVDDLLELLVGGNGGDSHFERVRGGRWKKVDDLGKSTTTEQLIYLWTKKVS